MCVCVKPREEASTVNTHSQTYNFQLWGFGERCFHCRGEERGKKRRGEKVFLSICCDLFLFLRSKEEEEEEEELDAAEKKKKKPTCPTLCWGETPANRVYKTSWGMWSISFCLFLFLHTQRRAARVNDSTLKTQEKSHSQDEIKHFTSPHEDKEECVCSENVWEQWDYCECFGSRRILGGFRFTFRINHNKGARLKTNSSHKSVSF